LGCESVAFDVAVPGFGNALFVSEGALRGELALVTPASLCGVRMKLAPQEGPERAQVFFACGA
jgi:hypothetical protein